MQYKGFETGDNVKVKAGNGTVYYIKSFNIGEDKVICATYNQITNQEEEHIISIFLLEKVNKPKPPSYTRGTINF